ncbi:class I SAM-dependent methyltransferase [Patescibacteria group bacterium]|nr:class I SAM-dependent methyltransferase [Patescibacteria group bacterium]
MTQGRMRDDLYPELYRVEDQHWWHRQKRQVIHQLIRQYAPTPGKVLDVGCGSGKLLFELESLGWQVEGVDAPQGKQQSQRRGLKISSVNLQNQPLPYPNHHFDLVVCLDTLEHMKDDQRLFTEMARITKAKGTIIISVPAYQWLFSYWDRMLGHFRRYNRSSLLKAVPKNRLRRRLVTYYFTFLLLPAMLIRLVKVIFRQKQQSDFTTDPLPVFTRSIVSLLGSFELVWLKRFRLPFGLSLIGVWQKK